MTGSGGVRLERWSAFALLLVSAGATWWLSEQAEAVAAVANQREEQLEHVATLVERRGEAGLRAPGALPDFDGLFAGQRIVWRDTGAGRVLSLQATDGTEAGR